MENVVVQEVSALLREESAKISAETQLIGEAGVLDSLGLVELCLRLEDRAAEFGFEFDWTSDAAMSRSRGMFRSVESLQAEFLRQSEGLT